MVELWNRDVQSTNLVNQLSFVPTMLPYQLGVLPLKFQEKLYFFMDICLDFRYWYCIHIAQPAGHNKLIVV